MKKSDESTSYSAMFDDDIMLAQNDWDHLLNNKVSVSNWKELDNSDIKIHFNKVKDEMLDQLKK